MWASIPYSHTQKIYAIRISSVHVARFLKNLKVHRKGQIYHYTHYSDETSEVCGHLST